MQILEIALARINSVSYIAEMQGGSDVLRLAGQALYGERWQMPLSRDLGVSDRMIRYWAAGSHDLPEEIADRLLGALRQRSVKVGDVIALIEQKLGR